jgi:hypothetical protein
VIALCLICRRLDGSERTVHFLAHASLHPHDHTTAGGAKSLAAADEEALAKLVGSFGYLNTERWHGFVSQASIITAGCGQSASINDSESRKALSALVSWAASFYTVEDMVYAKLVRRVKRPPAAGVR